MTDAQLRKLSEQISSGLKSTIREESLNAARNVEKAFIKNACAEVVPSAVEATLTKLGLDCTDPLESQKDFAHLRSSRINNETMSVRVKQRVVDWFVFAGLAGFAAWLTTFFQAKPPTPGG